MARPPEDAPFLSRWSQRKLDARSASEAEPEPAPPVEPPEAAAADPISEEELAALPDIETLTAGTDIRPFLRKGVPQALRNAALRKMWLLTPAIRDHADPAVDYAWDWNTPGGVPGDGAAPTPERAAQMLRELVAPRPKPPPEEAPALAEDSPPAEEEREGRGEAAPSTSADARPEQAGPDRATDAAPEAGTGTGTATGADVKTATPLAARRHGGALPS